MNDIYERMKNSIILIAFDDIIVDTLSNTKFNPIASDVFIRGRQLNIYFVFVKILDQILHTFLL